jgi:hypothetical protein
MALFPLPPLITLNQYGGDWERYSAAIYKEFVDNVVNAGLTFLGLPLSYQRLPEFQGMHYSFWHLITEDKERTRSDEDRIPDMRRCERVSWIAHIIRNAGESDSGIRCWENERHGNKHIVLWLEEERFLIILAKRKEYVLLKTMYCHSEWKVRKLAKECAESKDPRKD